MLPVLLSLYQAAETEALDILKGAEVERSALLKRSKAESRKNADEVAVEVVNTTKIPADVAS